MAIRVRCAFVSLVLVLGSALCAYAQLRPEVTVKPKPKKPPAAKVTPKPSQIIVETSPGAEVYLDDQFAGRASPQGRLVVGDPAPGEHRLRVVLPGKRDYQQDVSVAAGEVANVAAPLADLPVITIPSPTGEPTSVVAHTHDELIALAQRTDRDYFEFDLPRINARQKIGAVLIELVGTNPEKNHFTVYLYFDYKRAERKDEAINEPVHFFMQGASTALELVVNKLGKDSISGYISTPKGFFAKAPGVLSARQAEVGNGGLGPGEGGGFGGGAYSVGGSVTAPIPIYKPEPPYSEEARKAKYQGTVVVLIFVDTQGSVTDARVVKPLGLGLDEKALETVRTWKFKPGMRNGVPVPVRVMIEVSFRIPQEKKRKASRT